MASHHCQLLWYAVGKSFSAGWLGLHKIPKVVGGWLFVHAVFQKILEKPICTSPPFCGLTDPFFSVSNTFPPLRRAYIALSTCCATTISSCDFGYEAG